MTAFSPFAPRGGVCRARDSRRSRGRRVNPDRRAGKKRGRWGEAFLRRHHPVQVQRVSSQSSPCPTPPASRATLVQSRGRCKRRGGFRNASKPGSDASYPGGRHAPPPPGPTRPSPASRIAPVQPGAIAYNDRGKCRRKSSGTSLSAASPPPENVPSYPLPAERRRHALSRIASTMCRCATAGPGCGLPTVGNPPRTSVPAIRLLPICERCPDGTAAGVGGAASAAVRPRIK